MSYRERRDTAPPDCKVYVGNLGSGASRNELEKEFSYFGRLSNVWVARNPPGFAYIEFEDSRDAKDACRELDGRMLCGRRAKVELSHGKPRQRSSRPVYFGGHPPRRSLEDLRCYQCGGRGHMARNCSRRSRSRSRSPRRRSKSRSRSRSRKDSRSRSRKDSRSRSRKDSCSRSRSRSPSRKRDSKSRSRSRDRSESPEPKSNGRRQESRSRSRSRSPDE